MSTPTTLNAIKLSGTTTAGGAATVTGEYLVYGLCHAIRANLSGLDATADVTVSVTNLDAESENLLVQADSQTDKTYYPRTLEQLDTDGTALTTHTLPVVAGKLKVVVAQGGASKPFDIWVFLI